MSKKTKMKANITNINTNDKLLTNNKLPIGNDLVSVLNMDYNEPTEFGVNYLNFTVSGSNVNNIFTNTICRTIISLVGCYAFNGSNIKFETNTSIFNRDVLRLRLSNIPIIYNNYMYDIESNFAETCVNLEKERNESFGKEILELERIEKENKKSQLLSDNLHMYVNAINNTNDIMYVTTNKKYTTFYKNGNVIPDIYPREVHIIALKPGQEINFIAISDFNIPLTNGIYSSAYKSFHRYIDDNTYRVTIMSNRQIPEKKIVCEACKIINIKLDNLRSMIFNIIKSEMNIAINPDYDYQGILNVPNENHTIAEIFIRRIQDNKFTKFAGFTVPHPDENNFIFKYLVEGMPIIKIIDNVIDSLKEDYQIIINALS